MTAATIKGEPVQVPVEPAKPVIITSPGIYDIPEDAYHGDPVPAGSLSSSGAKRLLAPSCPAIFDYERKNGRAPKTEFNIGHGVHKLILGIGNQIDEHNFRDWKTDLAKAAKKASYEAGHVPLLSHELRMAERIAEALWAQPHAASQFDPDGLPEQSLFWVDEATGMWCRARPDWFLPYKIVDLKTSTSADTDHVARQIYNLSYFQQAAWYLDGALELDLIEPDAPFNFVVMSKEAPYLATVHTLDDEALEVGRARNRRALEIFRDCTQSGYWPGHSTEIEVVSLPAWAVRRELEGNF